MKSQYQSWGYCLRTPNPPSSTLLRDAELGNHISFIQNLFYFWPPLVFIALSGLSLVAASRATLLLQLETPGVQAQ